MTPANQTIMSLRDEPEKWRQGQHTLDHENGVEVWTANGLFFLSIWKPQQRKFSITEKIRVRHAIKQWSKLPLMLSAK